MSSTDAQKPVIKAAVDVAGGIRPAQRLLNGLTPNYHDVRNVARANSVQTAERRLFVSDMHVPDHDPSALAVVRAFKENWKPHKVTVMGDVINADAVSMHAKTQTRYDQSEEYAIAGEILDWLEPDEILEGNHEERFRRPGCVPWELWAMLNPQKWFEIEKRGVRWIPYSNHPEDLMHVGKLTVIHGFRTNEYAAKAEALSFGCVIHAHTHRVQNFQPKHAYEKHTGFNIGCLCKLDLEYQTTGTPRGWAQAFAFGYFFRDGNFSLYTARLIGDEFIIEGEYYHR